MIENSKYKLVGILYEDYQVPRRRIDLLMPLIYMVRSALISIFVLIFAAVPSMQVLSTLIIESAVFSLTVVTRVRQTRLQNSIQIVVCSLNVLFLILKAVTLFDIADRTRQVHVGIAIGLCLATNALINITFLLISTIMKLIASAILVFKQMKVLCNKITCCKKQALQSPAPAAPASCAPMEPVVVALPQPEQSPSSAPKKRRAVLRTPKKVLSLFHKQLAANESRPQQRTAGQARNKVFPAEPTTNPRTEARPGLRVRDTPGEPVEKKHRPLKNKPMAELADLHPQSQVHPRPGLAVAARDPAVKARKRIFAPKLPKLIRPNNTRLVQESSTRQKKPPQAVFGLDDHPL
jgi:hypothetical protein